MTSFSLMCPQLATNSNFNRLLVFYSWRREEPCVCYLLNSPPLGVACGDALRIKTMRAFTFSDMFRLMRISVEKLSPPCPPYIFYLRKKETAPCSVMEHLWGTKSYFMASLSSKLSEQRTWSRSAQFAEIQSISSSARPPSSFALKASDIRPVGWRLELASYCWQFSLSVFHKFWIVRGCWILYALFMVRN
jgi:hypothetical protein